MRKCAGVCAGTLLLLFSAFPAAFAAPVEIGGVLYDSVDEGEPFVEMTAPPAKGWAAPKPSRAESRAGMIAFQTDDPGEYVPDRVPGKGERVKGLEAVVTPGETTAVWVGVHALKDLSGFEAAVDVEDAPVSVELKHLHCWPQRTGWKSRRWTIVPELLLPFSNGNRTVPLKDGVLKEEPFDLKKGATAGLWLTVSARADAAPGRHKGLLSLGGAGGKTLTLSLVLEVLPFRLTRPEGKHWLLYCDAGRWRSMGEEQVMGDLRDFAAHGFNGLVSVPFGDLDLSGMAEGRITFDDTPYRTLVARCQAAGMPGPHVCSFSGIPARVRERLGVECDLSKDVWPDVLKKGVTDAARAIVETTKDAGALWYFYGVDEPTGENTFAIQEYQCWHAAGALTYATFFNINFLEKASEFLTAPCFVSGLVSEEARAREAREACAKSGAEFWWYGTGCYSNPYPQESGLFFNRYGAGLFFWKTGAKSQVTWTFSRPHADPFNDFDGTPENDSEPKDQTTVYPHLLRPNDWSTYQGSIPTVAWEALREGYNDYLYLHTLAEAVKSARAGGNPRLQKRADRAEKEMAALVEALPFHNPMSRQPREDRVLRTTTLQKIRRAAAEHIAALQ